MVVQLVEKKAHMKVEKLVDYSADRMDTWKVLPMVDKQVAETDES